jgi:6-pyruvoyltetrahydropterin/6-carboxytetrahydropterin synthase
MSSKPVVTISRKFSFESAHKLTAVPDEHKCRTMHGHTYTLEVEARGVVNPSSGWLMDYAEITEIVKPVVSKLDHKTLNEIGEFEHTTSEELAVWFWENIKPTIPQLYRISIMENPNTRCDFYGEFNNGNNK